ncbi:MAG TPA: NAD(P)H-dependent oxidoreductase [Prevotella sp.]
MKKVLIVSGHTDLSNNSVANKTIIEELKRLLPEAEFDILSELYPDYRIDVAVEQQKLVAADVIVWQFPVFWYSMPSLLRKWIEEVIVHGFAYGSTGTALKDKRLIASFTTGAPAEAYSRENGIGYTIDDILGSQLRPTAALCNMNLTDCIYTGGVSYASRNDETAMAGIVERSKDHARRLAEAINK